MATLEQQRADLAPDLIDRANEWLNVNEPELAETCTDRQYAARLREVAEEIAELDDAADEADAMFGDDRLPY